MKPSSLERLALILAAFATACAQSSSTTADASAQVPSPVTAAGRAYGPVPSGVSARAMNVYRDAIVIDTHNDLPTRMIDEGVKPDMRLVAGYNGPDSGHTDVPRLVESGIDAQFFSIWPDAEFAWNNTSYARAIQEIDTVDAFVRRHPQAMTMATTASDVDRAVREGKVAILMGVEGGHAIENSLDKLRELHRRGARYMTLTWNNGNDWAGAAAGLRGTRKGGLTDFGRQVVREMNRLGMLVDISHVSDSTFWDVIATTTMPVIASHSSARAINDHSRNMSDDMLRAVAKNGGVVNVNFYSLFIDPRYRSDIESMDRELRAIRDGARARGDTVGLEQAHARRRAQRVAAITATPLAVLIDHFDHIAKVAGVDHVGIGSDFDGVSALPAGMEDVTALPRIAQGLLDRGYSEIDVKKMLGGNMMRVMRRAIR